MYQSISTPVFAFKEGCQTNQAFQVAVHPAGCQTTKRMANRVELLSLSPTAGHTNAYIALAWLGDRRSA